MTRTMIALSTLLFCAACDESKGPAPAQPQAAETQAAHPVMPAQGTVGTAAKAAATPAAAAPAANAPATEPAPIAVGTKMKCPVSGEDFTVKPTTQQVVYNGKRYAFCCPDCGPQFKQNPTKYVTQ